MRFVATCNLQSIRLSSQITSHCILLKFIIQMIKRRIAHSTWLFNMITMMLSKTICMYMPFKAMLYCDCGRNLWNYRIIYFSHKWRDSCSYQLLQHFPSNSTVDDYPRYNVVNLSFSSTHKGKPNQFFMAICLRIELYVWFEYNQWTARGGQLHINLIWCWKLLVWM